MAFANVHSGTAVIGSSGGALSPTCTAATAGNLLVMPVAGGGAVTAPAAPANWTKQATKAGNSGCSATIMWLIAAGGETGATIAAVTGVTLAAQILEFSGNAGGTPTDQVGVGNGTTGTTTGTFGGADAQSGQLVVSCGVVKYSANAAESLATTITTAGSVTEATNNASSGVSTHYDFAWAITTSNGGADVATLTFGTTNITGSALSAWSFKLAAVSGTAGLLSIFA